MPKSRRKKRGPGDIRHQLLIFFAALIVLEGILVFVAIEYRSKQAALRQDAGILLRARELAHNARVKNNELHLLAKDAVAYGDPRSIRDYEARARPQASDAELEGGGVILRDQPNPRARDKQPEGTRVEEMPRFDPALASSQEQVQTNLRQISTKSVQFQGDELSVFDTALAASKDQRTAEIKAINALKGNFQDRRGEFTIQAPADPKLAAQILSDPEYEKTVRAVQKGFSDFLSTLDVRLFAVHKQSAKTFSLNFIIALSMVLFASTVVVGLLLYRSLNITIRKLKINARNLTDELGRVNNELHAAVVSREDMRRQLERVSALGGPAAVANPPSPPRDDSQPEFNDFLTRLP